MVTLTISAPIGVAPASLSFTCQMGSATTPAAQNLAVSSTPAGTGFTATASTTSGGNWLSVPANAGGTTAGTIAVSVNPTGLIAGSYSGSVAVTPTQGSAVTVPVTLTVQEAAGTMTVAPTSLSFSYQLGSSSLPAVQSISVFNKFSSVSFSASASSSGNWLSAGSGGTTPGSVAVSVNVSNLGAGTLTGIVTISSASAASISVPVTITVSAASAPVLSVSPGLETFSLAQGSAATGGQVTVSDTGGGTLQFTAQAGSDKGWFKLSGSGAGSATPTAPASLAFTVDLTGLNPGLYSGHITVSQSSSSNSATVSVILTVTKNAQSIQLSERGLLLTAVAGGAQPQAQSFTVANSGSGTLSWTAQASTLTGGNWLSVSPGSGMSASGQPGTPVSVSANTTGLTAGQYFGSVNITSASATNNPQTVSVFLNVVATWARRFPPAA